VERSLVLLHVDRAIGHFEKTNY